jgi:hypothetical protein
MGHWARECRSKPKKEQAYIMQDEEESSLMLASTTLIRPEVISSSAEVENHEKVFAHLDEEKERDARTWVLDTGATNQMFECRAAFTKIDMTVLSTVRFGDDSVARIEGRGIVVFMCKNGVSRSVDGVYFIPRLTTNIASVGQLDEIGYKIDIDTGMMKI